MSQPRVLVVAHGHPDFSVGGGELAAYSEWCEMRRRGVEAVFLARISQSPRHAGTAFSNRSPDGTEVLFSVPPVDHFRHSQTERRMIHGDFRALLERLKPTVVHFHHYVHLGLEMIREVRNTLPHAVIVLTLHEFLAICHAQGQMLKVTGLLCEKAAPLDCHQCFPNIVPQDFFLREVFVKSFLNLCDQFVCPSEFLRNRYIQWGLPAEKMRTLENGQPRDKGPPDVPDSALRTRFLVLGQLSRLKGTLLVLEAVRLLPKSLRGTVIIEIHGSLQHENEEFKQQFDSALGALEDTVRYCGPYRHCDVNDIIRGSGWVIQPSLWWENSPLVIQEAFALGRPVICSNIGGMAEKVTHGVSGLHFRVGSANALAACLRQGAMQPGLWEGLCAAVPRPPGIDETVDTLLELYQAARSVSGLGEAPAPTANTPTQRASRRP